MNNSNIQSTKDRLKRISNEKGVEFNVVLRMHIYDSFVGRISQSQYCDNFILKGGYYLSQLYGVDNRSTIDIDTEIRNARFTIEEITNMIEKVIDVDLGDGIKYSIVDISDIRGEGEYGGFRVRLKASIGKMIETFHVDVVTGDSVYPGPRKFEYKALLNEEVYGVWSYNIETVLAEKLETIMSRLESSSRLKDYYDVYLIMSMSGDDIDTRVLGKAVKKTFEKREYNGNLLGGMKVVERSERLRREWRRYAEKNEYARRVEYEQIVDALQRLVSMTLA